MSAVRHYVIDEDDDGIRLDRWFKRHLPEVGPVDVARWARTGQIRLDGCRARPGSRVEVGQKLRVPPAHLTSPTAHKPRDVPALDDDEIAFARSLVIHMDDRAIILNKPPGLASQGGNKVICHVDGLLDALRFDAPTRPRLVHRLDKDTSGLLLLARSARAAAFFSRMFATGAARKTYWALAMGHPVPESGQIDAPLGKQAGTGSEKRCVDVKDGRPARTRYRVVDTVGDRASWLELQPLTGRTHQLRVHCLAIGHPIVGDGKYGGRDAFLTGGISRKLHLHARRLRIPHPDGGRLDISAPLPQHMQDSFTLLGFDSTMPETES